MPRQQEFQINYVSEQKRLLVPMDKDIALKPRPQPDDMARTASTPRLHDDLVDREPRRLQAPHELRVGRRRPDRQRPPARNADRAASRPVAL
jgi:hypothetical protein